MKKIVISVIVLTGAALTSLLVWKRKGQLL